VGVENEDGMWFVWCYVVRLMYQCYVGDKYRQDM
jgi:hypothetical protein